MTPSEKVKEELRTQWGVDFYHPHETPWECQEEEVDGTQFVLQITPSANQDDVNFRIFRSWLMLNNTVGVSIDVDTTGKTLQSLKLEYYPYNNDERGEVEHWRKALRDELGGDVQFLWHAPNRENGLSFVAKTIRIGSEERIVAGTVSIKDNIFTSEIDLDKPTAELLNPKPKSEASMKMR